MKRILFVDDDPNVTSALKRALHKEPYEVLNANSATEALELLRQTRVDVIVSDEQMPGMLGSQFLALVAKQQPETMRIILTGHANIDSAIRAINEGQIYRFLKKPCREGEMIATIRQALEHKDLIEMSQKLLKENQRQASLIRALEKENPGITQVKRNESGTLLLDDDDLDPPQGNHPGAS